MRDQKPKEKKNRRVAGNGIHFIPVQSQAAAVCSLPFWWSNDQNRLSAYFHVVHGNEMDNGFINEMNSLGSIIDGP